MATADQKQPLTKDPSDSSNASQGYLCQSGSFKVKTQVLAFFCQVLISAAIVAFCITKLSNANATETDKNIYSSILSFVVGTLLPSFSTKINFLKVIQTYFATKNGSSTPA